jgi:hypothetical protein
MTQAARSLFRVSCRLRQTDRHRQVPHRVIVEPETSPEHIERRVDELMERYDQDSEALGREWIEDPCSCTKDREQAADPNCDDCEGSGIVSYSYNPQEVFDWYEPGGRWDGQIRAGAVTLKELDPGCQSRSGMTWRWFGTSRPLSCRGQS